MLLTVDVGNTQTSVGVWDGDALRGSLRFRTDRAQTADEWAAQLSALLPISCGVVLRDFAGVALASVVPSAGDALAAMAETYVGVAPLRAVPGVTDTGLTVAYDPPESLGADRLVNALAAWETWGKPQGADCIVVDYGTATKLEAVTAGGIYRGGAILPGVGLSLDALFDRAALLRRIPLTAPSAAIGTNTADALRSGILWGYGAQTDGLVRRFRAEMGDGPVRVIATGGWSGLVAPYAETVETVEPNLTLIGLRLLWERGR